MPTPKTTAKKTTKKRRVKQHDLRKASLKRILSTFARLHTGEHVSREMHHLTKAIRVEANRKLR